MPRRTTLVTVEEIADDDLLADDRLAAGTIPALYIRRHRAGAARRLAGRPAPRATPPDHDHLRRYAELAASADGFARYLERYVLERIAAE